MDYLRTVAIFLHLMIFAWAITALYRSDWQLFFKRPSLAEVHELGDHMLVCLLGLWMTGLVVVWVDTGFVLAKIWAANKLLTKLTCVAVLTINAFVIHGVVFKKLEKQFLTYKDLRLMAIAGAVSSASWTFAAFLGIAKPLVGHLNLLGFLGLYGLVLGGAVLAAVLLCPIIESNWIHAQASAARKRLEREQRRRTKRAQNLPDANLPDALSVLG